MAPPEKPKCRTCKKEKCFEHCQEVPDGKHVPSRLTKDINVAFVAGTPGNYYAIIDVNCVACGISGSTKVYFKDLIWS
jgi:hypothetical protein